MSAVQIVLALALQAPAQEPAQPPPPPPAMQRTKLTLSTFDSYRFDTDLDNAPGRVAVGFYKASFDFFHMFDMQNMIRINGGVDWLHYDWSSDAALIPGVLDPFEDVYTWRLESTFMHGFDEHWTGLAYASAYWMFEEDANLADAVSYGLGLGAMYRVDKDLTFGAVLRAQTRPEDHPWIFPVPYVDWKISPDVTLKTEEKAGYGLGLSWSLDEARQFSFESRMYYWIRRFRLEDDAMPTEGVAQDQRFAWDAGVRYQPSSSASVAAYVGVDLWQDFKVEDHEGDDIAEVESKPSPFVAVSLSWSF
jgi:hypothetical protein